MYWLSCNGTFPGIVWPENLQVQLQVSKLDLNLIQHTSDYIAQKGVIWLVGFCPSWLIDNF